MKLPVRHRAFPPAAILLAQLLLVPAQPLAQSPPHQPQTEMRAVWSEANWAVAARILQNASDEGLEPSDYRPSATNDAARTAAASAYARDLRLGRDRLRGLDKDILLPEQVFDAPAALALALKDNRLEAFFSGLPPPAGEYARLRSALARYRAIAAGGGWGSLTARAPETDLRARLESEYPSLAGIPTDIALKHFQDRHGLPADAKLSRATLAALNVPAAERAQKIAANMERWRWLPRPLEASRIAVNVPAAILTLWTEGKVALESRVIVGKPATPTPILRANGIGVTVNPAWTVPRSIAVKEMLPKLRHNPAWLKSQNIILLNGPPGDPHGLLVNWRGLSQNNFPYRLQQLPGSNNALGLIKLELPNRFDVYLHDTPGKGAFAASQRALSHGCVRVEQIMPLAAHALSDDSRQAAQRIADAIAVGQTRTLPLPRTLPVYFLYLTAQADARGEMQFWPDLYGRDRRLLLQLRAPDLRIAHNVKCPTG